MKLYFANQLFKQGKYKSALDSYLIIKKNNPELSKITQFNIDLCIKKLDLEKINRCAIFASYNPDGKINSYVVRYLKSLREICTKIIFVADCNIDPEELKKIQDLFDHAIIGRHEEYDFGSYKRGYQYIIENGSINDIDELILCNDSCYGPLKSFDTIFKKMSIRTLDFWGLTQNTQFKTHLQSFFLVFKKNVIVHDVFKKFLLEIKKQKSVNNVIQSYEVTLTGVLESEEFKWDSYLDPKKEIVKSNLRLHANPTVFPISLLKEECELIKVKSVQYPNSNFEGINNTLNYIKDKNYSLYKEISSHTNLSPFENFNNKFSIIIVTRNDIENLKKSILSVLNQKTDNYEIIIIDDNSPDGTEYYVSKDLSKYIESGKIKYHKNKTDIGYAASKNIGLQIASEKWIAYLEPGNFFRPNFLLSFSDEIARNPEISVIYAKYSTIFDRVIHGKKFDYSELISKNFINLGALIHKKDLIYNSVFFDTSLQQLIDFDFILNISKQNTPHFLDICVLDTHEKPKEITKLSITDSSHTSYLEILEKQKIPLKVTTVIIINDDKYDLERSILSAIMQKGNFEHEIFIFDNSCEENNIELINQYSKSYKDIKIFRHLPKINSELIFKKALNSGQGQFLNILMSGDYWIDDEKINKQLNFIKNNKECSMVFSKKLDINNESPLSKNEEISESIFEKINVKNISIENIFNESFSFSSCLYIKPLLDIIPNQLFSDRFNEFSIAFFMENFGKIGFIKEPSWSSEELVLHFKKNNSNFKDLLAPINEPSVLEKKFVRETDIFDYDYYLKQFPHIINTKEEPIEHYFRNGRFIDIHPNKYFIPREYLSLHPDVAKAGVDPFLHYLKSGALEGRRYRVNTWRETNETPFFRYSVLNATIIDWKSISNRKNRKEFVSIIIPIYGQHELTENCINSIIKSKNKNNYEIICVDNGSDKIIKDLIDKFMVRDQRIKYIKNKENYNFALGCNIGFREASGEYSIFLNNDTTVTDFWLDEIIKPLKDPRIVAVQPKLVYPDNKIQNVGIVFAENQTLGYPIYADFDPEEKCVNISRAYQAVTGACMAVRSIDFSNVKGFDTLFINGQEDVDLCLRLIKQNNKSCWYQSTSLVIHHESRTPGRGRYIKFNRENFVKRWKSYIIPDDFKYYTSDKFSISELKRDNEEMIKLGLGVCRPVLVKV